MAFVVRHQRLFPPELHRHDHLGSHQYFGSVQHRLTDIKMENSMIENIHAIMNFLVFAFLFTLWTRTSVLNFSVKFVFFLMTAWSAIDLLAVFGLLKMTTSCLL